MQTTLRVSIGSPACLAALLLAIGLRTVGPAVAAAQQAPTINQLRPVGITNTSGGARPRGPFDDSQGPLEITTTSVAALTTNLPAADIIGPRMPVSSAEPTLPTNIVQLRALADKGNARAQYELGSLLRATNRSEAISWFEKSASQNYLPAFRYLWSIYGGSHVGLYGDPNATNAPFRDARKATDYARKGAELGDAYCQTFYALGLLNGVGTATNIVEGVRWLTKSAEAGRSWAADLLGRLYADGILVPTNLTWASYWEHEAHAPTNRSPEVRMGDKLAGLETNFTEAVKWYRKAADQGDAEAEFRLAGCYALAQGVPHDETQAFHWLRKAAEQGHAQAEFRLAEAFAGGRGIRANPADAVRWCRAAADQGHAEAQYNMATFYLEGYAVARDESEAFRWCRKSADQGRADARVTLGSMFEWGKGTQEDLAEAFRWYRKAAEQGDATGQRFLGICYRKGRGVAQDWTEAFKWLTKAAEQGDGEAMACLGEMNRDGEGVPRDATLAAKWFGRAIDKEIRGSACNLGALYETGKGIPQDWAEALKCYRLDANRGVTPAQANLARMYAYGRGTPADYTEAYKWANLIAAGADEDAVRFRNWLTARMTPEQIAEGQRRSAAFIARAETAPGQHAATADFLPQQRFNSLDARPAGTAFFITTDGYLATSFHVVSNAAGLLVSHGGKSYPASLVKFDRANDVAVLKVEGTFKPLALAASRRVKLGDAAFTLGFPNTDLQGLEPKLTRGEISGLSGLQDDPRHFQISVAVQPGNSGGPLVNLNGEVIGVVTARLSEAVTLKLTGSLPQNVNYALKSSFLTAFLETLPDVAAKLPDPPPAQDHPFNALVEQVRQSVVLISVY